MKSFTNKRGSLSTYNHEYPIPDPEEVKLKLKLLLNYQPPMPHELTFCEKQAPVPQNGFTAGLGHYQSEGGLSLYQLNPEEDIKSDYIDSEEESKCGAKGSEEASMINNHQDNGKWQKNQQMLRLTADITSDDDEQDKQERHSLMRMTP